MLYQGIIGGGSSPVEPVDLSPVLLWTNPRPGSAFGAQTVSLDLTEYSGVIIEINHSDTSQRLATRVYAKKTDNLSVFGCGFIADVAITRNILAVNNNGVQFGAVNTGTEVCIPSKIYGVKEYVVDSNLSKEIVPSDYVNFNASTGFTAVVGTYYAVVQASDNNADPTFNGATILKTGFNQRVSSGDRAYLSIIQATSTTITSNKNGTYCALNLE